MTGRICQEKRRLMHLKYLSILEFKISQNCFATIHKSLGSKKISKVIRYAVLLFCTMFARMPDYFAVLVEKVGLRQYIK